MCTNVGIVAVDNVYLTLSDTRCALHASLVKPTVSYRGVEVTYILGVLIARTYEQWETVVVGSALAVRPEGKEITEAAPCDAHVVSASLDVETSINTIDEVTVVHPNVLTCYQLHVVGRAIVESTCTVHHDVTDDDVLTLLEIEYARRILVCSMYFIIETCARLTVECEVLCPSHIEFLWHVDVGIEIDGAIFHMVHSLRLLESGLHLIKCCNVINGFGLVTSYSIAERAPAYRLVGIIL